MRKRCLALAFLLALTAVVPARASSAETILKSEILLQPVIEVTVPQSGRIILNPYGLPTEIDGRTTTEQIAGETMPIVNSGDTPVTVSASAAGQIFEGSSAVYVPAPPQADATEKEIFLYAEFQPMDGLWAGVYDGASNQILISDNPSEQKEVLLIDAYSQGMFCLFGAMTVQPANPWSVEDEITVTIIFSFSPAATQSQESISDTNQPNLDGPFAPEETIAPIGEFVPEETFTPPETFPPD